MTVHRKVQNRTDDRGRRRLWAFLYEPAPTRGPQRLFDQKRTVDAIAEYGGHDIERYVVDSGGARTRNGASLRLAEVCEEVRVTDLDVMLIVADASALAPTRALRKVMIASLHGAGIILKDGSGEWHPSATTVGCAKLPSTRRDVVRRRKREPSHD